MDEKAEKAWKWFLRGLGVLGFLYLLVAWQDAPVAFYALLGGLLGLPNIIEYQLQLNRERRAAESRDQGGPGDG